GLSGSIVTKSGSSARSLSLKGSETRLRLSMPVDGETLEASLVARFLRDKLGVTGSSPVPPIEKPCKTGTVVASAADKNDESSFGQVDRPRGSRPGGRSDGRSEA